MKLEELQTKHQKLNKIEKLKLTRTPKEAIEKIREYAKNGYDSIPKEDLSYFLKCFGIFDRASTPKQFMMRIRVTAGRLNSDQALMIGKMAKDFGNDHMELTTRMQIQLRYLHIEDIPTVMDSLEGVGITSYQTGVDNFRNIVSDPLNSLSFDNLIDVYPLIEQMQTLWLKKEEWIATIPRKFNTAISGSLTNRCNLFAHDCCFALAMKDGEYGFNVYLGGRVGMIAKNADIFLRYDKVVPFYESLIKLYKTYGFKDSRNKNRLHFLIKEAGVKTVTNAIKDDLNIDFKSTGDTLVKQPRTEERDGRIRLKDGTFALHMVVPAGLFSGTAMMEAGNLADNFGDSQLRLSTTQNLFVTGVEEKTISKVLKQKPYDKFKSLSTTYFNHLISCAGLNCPYGIIDSKPEAIKMADFLSEAVPLPPDAKVRMHWSACIKGCGVHELADIGFLGCKARIGGDIIHGVDIQMGGKSTFSQEEAYTVIKSSPIETAKYYAANLLQAYKDLRKENESFEHFESRVFRQYSKGAINFILKWNTDICAKRGFSNLDFLSEFKKLEEHNEIFLLGLDIYKKLTGGKAYAGIHLYEPIESTSPKHLSKVNPTIEKELGDIIMKMIAPTSKRYEVFSEITHALFPTR